MLIPKDFCSWLEGVLDMAPDGLTSEQVKKIQDKLKTVEMPKAAIGGKDPVTGELYRC